MRCITHSDRPPLLPQGEQRTVSCKSSSPWLKLVLLYFRTLKVAFEITVGGSSRRLFLCFTYILYSIPSLTLYPNKRSVIIPACLLHNGRRGESSCPSRIYCGGSFAGQESPCAGSGISCHNPEECPRNVEACSDALRRDPSRRQPKTSATSAAVGFTRPGRLPW